jgi:hypothetical protein
MYAFNLERRDSEISEGVTMTSVKKRRVWPTAFLKGFSVYGRKDSGIGNPLKGNKLEVLKLSVFILVKVNDDAFD